MFSNSAQNYIMVHLIVHISIIETSYQNFIDDTLLVLIDDKLLVSIDGFFDF